jgi:hypothetical protein
MVNTPQPYAGDTKSSPVIACIIGAIISCILAAGIIVTYIPKQAPLWGPIMWVCIAAVLTVATIGLVLRKEPFARRLFFTVAKWVFLYILVLTGIGEYVIAFDGVRGEPLVVMTIILLLFLVNIPMLWGFSVARHERAPS